MDHHRQRVDHLAVHQDIDLHEIALAITVELVIEAGIAPADGFEPVVEVEHHLVQGQPVHRHRTAAHIGEFDLLATAFGAQLQDRAEILVGHHDRGLDPGLVDGGDARHVGIVGRVVEVDLLPVRERDVIDDRRCRRDDLQVELAFEPLLDDLHMKQPQKAAAETHAQRGGAFGLEFEAGIVQMQPAQRLAQILILRRVGGIERGKHDRDRRLEARQGGGGGPAVVGDRIADVTIRDRLDLGGDKPDLARAERAGFRARRGEHADPVHGIGDPRRHHPDLLALFQPPMLDPDQRHDAQIGVVPAVHQQRLQVPIGVAFG